MDVASAADHESFSIDVRTVSWFQDPGHNVRSPYSLTVGAPNSIVLRAPQVPDSQDRRRGVLVFLAWRFLSL